MNLDNRRLKEVQSEKRLYTSLYNQANEKDKQSIAPIPMIFVSKNLAPLDNIMTADYASQEDLAPTLLNLMGLATPAEFMGRNLLENCEKPMP